ncbi:MAG: DUF1707 domain-containing protein [Arachnia sp.]
MSENDMRVGDSERDETAAQLSEHFAAGRLDHSEFAERTEQALSARTRGELDGVVSDLPALPVFVKPSTIPAPTAHISPAQRSEREEWRRSTLTTWAVFAVVFTVIWAATGAGFFWPLFPILGWGIGVASSGIQAYRSPETLPGKGSSPHRQDTGLPLSRPYSEEPHPSEDDPPSGSRDGS